jgi:hypothetical protein
VNEACTFPQSPQVVVKRGRVRPRRWRKSGGKGQTQDTSTSKYWHGAHRRWIRSVGALQTRQVPVDHRSIAQDETKGFKKRGLPGSCVSRHKANNFSQDKSTPCFAKTGPARRWKSKAKVFLGETVRSNNPVGLRGKWPDFKLGRIGAKSLELQGLKLQPVPTLALRRDHIARFGECIRLRIWRFIDSGHWCILRQGNWRFIDSGHRCILRQGSWRFIDFGRRLAHSRHSFRRDFEGGFFLLKLQSNDWPAGFGFASCSGHNPPESGPHVRLGDSVTMRA